MLNIFRQSANHQLRKYIRCVQAAREGGRGANSDLLPILSVCIASDTLSMANPRNNPNIMQLLSAIPDHAPFLKDSDLDKALSIESWFLAWSREPLQTINLVRRR